MSHASASHTSLYGTITSAWRLEDGRLHLDVTVPANTTATASLPGAEVAAVTESGKPLAEADGVSNVRQEKDKVTLELASGSYALVAVLA